MFGGIILYLSMFYKRHNLMFRLGVFYCAAPLSGYVDFDVRVLSGCLAKSLIVHSVVFSRLDYRR